MAGLHCHARGADAAPFSAPATQAVRNFVESRVIGGVQQLKASIDYHAFSELICGPFGHTRADTAPGLTQDDRDTFATLAEGMARTNGYTAQQSSDLYITDDGALDDSRANRAPGVPDARRQGRFRWSSPGVHAGVSQTRKRGAEYRATVLAPEIGSP